jgi:hypothetical protein
VRILCAALATAGLLVAQWAFAEYSFSFSAHAQNDQAGAASGLSGTASLLGSASGAAGSSLGGSDSGAPATANANQSGLPSSLSAGSPGANVQTPDSVDCIDSAFPLRNSHPGAGCSLGAIAGVGIAPTRNAIASRSSNSGGLSNGTNGISSASNWPVDSRGSVGIPLNSISGEYHVPPSGGPIVLPGDGLLLQSQPGSQPGDSVTPAIAGSTAALFPNHDGLLENEDVSNPTPGADATGAAYPSVGDSQPPASIDFIDAPLGGSGDLGSTVGLDPIDPPLDLIDPPLTSNSVLDLAATAASLNNPPLDSAAVPEPGTLALFGLALLGVAILPRRRPH